MEQLFSLVIPVQAPPQPIKKILRRYGFSRSLLRRLKCQQAVYKNGQAARLVDLAGPGDELFVAKVPAAANIAPQVGELSLIYEDERLLAVNKPAGMLVHPLSQEPTGTLANFLAGYLNGQRFHLVGRLDRQTSGLVLVAKDPLTAAKLFRQRETGLWQPKYLAFVKGKVQGTGQIDLPLGRVDGKRWVNAEGKSALTRYRARAYTQEASLLEIELVTGRTNQIRIHFAAGGHPLLGEKLYAQEQTFWRPALHAWRVRLPGWLPLTAPLPADLQQLAARCGFDDET